MSDAIDMVQDAFDITNLQGNILRGYRRNVVRYLMLQVTDRAAARGFLKTAADGGSGSVPAITRESPANRKWSPSNPKPEICFNIGVTFEGLRALGVAAADLASFPTEFAEGMNKRAMKLGDFGTSGTACWKACFKDPSRLHLIASIYADDTEHLDGAQRQVAAAFTVLGVLDGENLPDDKVYFGYVDNISQPRFEHVKDPDNEAKEPIDPLGTVLLGYPTRMSDVRFRVPDPVVLGRDGTFNAFRVLAQDCAGFEAYLDEAAAMLLDHPKGDALLKPGSEGWIRTFWTPPYWDDGFFEGMLARYTPDHGNRVERFLALREVVAAQMGGRWRNGTPVELSPDRPWNPDAFEKPGDPPSPDTISLTNFDYGPASRCPAGSHLRRCNPRGGPIVQRIANYTRRLVRRGMSYGPDFDPLNPDDRERGLLGNFIGANLGAQFEAVMCDWLNLGLQDPDITGSNDPLIGANDPATSWFDLILPGGDTIRLRGFPRFVQTHGGAYTFLPSVPAIRYLASLAT